MMKLLDSNIIIYASEPEHQFLRPLIESADICVSAISRVEVLGFHRLSEAEARYLRDVLESIHTIPLNADVLNAAIDLRRQRKMSLADALIAGTCLLGNHTLVTRNIRDFEWIESLAIVNPFPSEPETQPPIGRKLTL